MPAEVIPRIVLLLSDQQLITTTAIFVAAYGNTCEIDALPFFSSVYYMGGASFLTPPGHCHGHPRSIETPPSDASMENALSNSCLRIGFLQQTSLIGLQLATKMG